MMGCCCAGQRKRKAEEDPASYYRQRHDTFHTMTAKKKRKQSSFLQWFCSHCCHKDNPSGDQRYLYAFDFDHTIVDGNSDTAIQALAPSGIPEEINNFYTGGNWTEYMNQVFQYLASQGVTVDSILEHVRDMKLTKGMNELLAWLAEGSKNRPESHIVIMSDANDLFIKARLDALPVDPPLNVNFIVTNPATVSQDKSILQISPYENQESCKICPKNLCKGEALDEYIGKHGPFTCVFYVGDGGNDYCPASRLRENDVVFVRQGYRLAKLIAAGKYKSDDVDIKAKVVFFSDAQTILENIQF